MKTAESLLEDVRVQHKLLFTEMQHIQQSEKKTVKNYDRMVEMLVHQDRFLRNMISELGWISEKK